MESEPQEISKEEGRRLLKSGQIDQAVEVLEKVLEADPDDAQTHCYLGVAYNMQGDRLRAIGAFEESLRLEPSAKAYYNLGLIYEASHRIDEAVREYEMALDNDANYTRARQALDKLHSRFESEHPNPGNPPQKADCSTPQQTQKDPGQTQQSQAAAAAPAQQEPAPAFEPKDPYAKAPSYEEQQARKAEEISEQHHALMKAGLIYGAVCGSAFMVGCYFASHAFMAVLPDFATTGGGMWILIGILLVIGAIYGGLIGLWVGTTCGGDSAGMQAGAVMGLVLGLIAGLIARAGVMAIVVGVVFAIFSGAFGMVIGRLVDMSIGD